MTKRPLPQVSLTLDRIIGGGQTIGTLPDGKKCLVWGGLPGEEVTVQLTKKKSSYVEGVVTEIVKASEQRIEPHDPTSYLSTSPWQIMDFAAENHYKSALIEEAFELHDIVLPAPITLWSDGQEYEYRNKVEYSFWYDTEKETLDLAFFRRGTHGKIAVTDTSLASPAINAGAKEVLQALRDLKIDGRSLKTLLIRSNREGQVAWQLYVKDEDFDAAAVLEKVVSPEVICAEIIYSNPKSPASVITKRLAASSDRTLTDTILDVPFRYATEGFFQINLPIYEQALRDMRQWIVDPFTSSLPKSSETASRWASNRAPASLEARAVDVSSDLVASGSPEAVPARVTRGGAAPTESSNASEEGADRAAGLAGSDLRGNSERISDDGSDRNRAVIDLYSGVGTIGLTIGGDNVTLVEINEHAVREMEQNIEKLGKAGAKAVLAASEDALDHITGDATIIVDPPRAGLHEKVVEKLCEAAPQRIIYLSCNPITQARDVARLAEKYGIRHHMGYNFFPRTPHIEHLVILDKI